MLLKTKIFLLPVLAFLLLMFFSCRRESAPADERDYLVVLSMDGFRWDYPEMYDTPNLDKIAETGVKAESMIASFPTKTFPNHYTLATGLYPDHHGIVLNSFYDPESERYYAILNREAVKDGNFYGGEPIWVTAEMQGVKTASLFWVGSEAEIKGVRPSIWKKYDHGLPYTDRIDTVLSWLEKPESNRPHLIMWYFDQPDGVGHDYGPDSPETGQTVHYLDSLVGVFMKRINGLPFAERVNFIVTSDHGMGNIFEEKVVMLDEYLESEWIAEIQGGNPNWNILAENGFEDEIYEALSQINHISCWRSGEVPAELNYGTHPRTLDFTIVADSAWSVFYDEPGTYFGGTHGFDNHNPDMQTIFYAYGPAFRRNYSHPAFENVNLYGIMCYVLQLDPAPNDGDFRKVEAMFKN